MPSYTFVLMNMGFGVHGNSWAFCGFLEQLLHVLFWPLRVSSSLALVLWALLVLMRIILL